ncbi:MAG: M48 family metallopeptidase [Planctomycetia bacterium]|nr:M48 family metallopeptidase [Planctomycetia bacterium]
MSDRQNDADGSPSAPPAGAAIESTPNSAEMSREQLAEAKQYGRLELLCSLADKGLDVGFLTLMAFAFAVPLDGWLARFVDSQTLRLVLIFLITTAAHIGISFPLSLYAGHTLEHRFGLSHQTFGRWLARYAKRNLLTVVFGVAMFVGLYWVIWLCGQWWWLAAAGAFFVVSIIFGQLMPVLILPLFYKIERLESGELTRRMTRLAEGTGLSIQGVYRMGLSEETAKANAMLTGLGRTRRVLMGDTLLEQFSPDEIEVIFAHEIGHHVFRHIRKMIVTGVLYSIAGFWICDRIILAWAHSHYGPLDAHQLPVGTLPLLMLVLTLFALVLEPVQNIISRRFERQCDRYALERTGLREAYVSAFRKLAKLNKDDPNPNPVEVFLFHSHPPISERLALAKD